MDTEDTIARVTYKVIPFEGKNVIHTGIINIYSLTLAHAQQKNI